MAANDGRSYVAGNFALVVDGFKNFGFLKEVSGGGIKADVINEKVGLDNRVFKNITGPKYEDLAMKIGMAMSPGMYDWIRRSWRKAYIRKNGSVISCDFDFNARSQRDFLEACITEVTLPELNGSAKDPCYMEVKIAPEEIKYRPGDGKKVSGEYGKGQQKRWLPCNFRFELDGMPCKKVNKVDKFTIKQKVTEDETGDKEGHGKEPAVVEYPNIKISLSQTDAQPWLDWFEDFAIAGNQGTDNEKRGRLVFLSPNLKDELGSMTFNGVGIYGFADDKGDASMEQIKRVSIDLYVEEMDFVFSGKDVIG